MKLKPFTAPLALMILALLLLGLFAPAFASPITYPGSPATDTAGVAVTSGVTVTVASLSDLDGTAKTSTLAVAHVAGGNVSAVYDAAVNGEAWAILTLTATGHTFAPVTLFCSSDPSTILAASTTSTANGVKIGTPVGASLAADIQTRSTYAGGPVASVTAPVVASAVTSPVTVGSVTAPVTLASTQAFNNTGQTTNLPATVNGYATGQDPFTLLMAGAVTTVSATLTTSGTAVTLSQKQLEALHASIALGGATQTVPAASSTGTVNYYLLGQTKTTPNLVAVSNPTFGATGVLTGRVILIAQPFPVVP